MTRKRLESILQDAALKVLEETAFVMATPMEGTPSMEGMISVKIPFTSPRKGAFYMACSEECASSMAEVLMDDDVQPIEIIGEILNMVSGIVFEEWLGHDVVYEMGTPVSAMCDEVLGAGARVTLETDEGHDIVVSMNVEV